MLTSLVYLLTAHLWVCLYLFWHFLINNYAIGELHIHEQISDVTAGFVHSSLTEFLVFSKVLVLYKVFALISVWLPVSKRFQVTSVFLGKVWCFDSVHISSAAVTIELLLCSQKTARSIMPTISLNTICFCKFKHSLDMKIKLMKFLRWVKNTLNALYILRCRATKSNQSKLTFPFCFKNIQNDFV